MDGGRARHPCWRREWESGMRLRTEPPPRVLLRPDTRFYDVLSLLSGSHLACLSPLYNLFIALRISDLDFIQVWYSTTGYYIRVLVFTVRSLIGS
ncbi:hypothetical protein NDU88_002889 [Pleurodeles waltl]|uniref:Uncharacterized protein n=1 Tax=Pleurodeles waltl TaxID=8319 RepID=A0AAV7KWN9_PLEWA|nr:hypothetical protein NDU88_002889 [Pleurodeles waltl]